VDPARLDEPLPTPQDAAGGLAMPPPFAWYPRRKFQDRVWLHVLLLALTIVSTTWLGINHYLGFISDFSQSPIPALQMSAGQLIVRGFWYAGTILAIWISRARSLLCLPLL
jgi:hypothetical protein